MLKTEIHILGGDSIDEVLHLDAWYDGARQFADAVWVGKVYRLVGMKKMDSSPMYSTSKCYITSASLLLLG